MALSADEQKLLDFALGSLPAWFGDAESRDLAVEAGMAKMVGAAKAQTTYWFDRSLITGADGPAAGLPDWLQQHAIDRGTRRQDVEGDPELQSRLRTFPDALTRATLLSVANAVLVAAGLSPDAVMLELRRDRGYLVTNQPQLAADGGTFSDQPGTGHAFTPAIGWRDGQPPFRGAGIPPPIVYKIEFSGSADGGNDGQYQISGVVGDAATYVNAAGVADVDTGAAWRVDRYSSVDDATLTGGAGKQDAFLSRGFRVGGQASSILLILPSGAGGGVAAAVLEAVRQRKAAGVQVIVEVQETHV